MAKSSKPSRSAARRKIKAPAARKAVAAPKRTGSKRAGSKRAAPRRAAPKPIARNVAPAPKLGAPKPTAPKPTARKPAAPKWVYAFGGGEAEGRTQMRDLLGGKGANLAEMANLG